MNFRKMGIFVLIGLFLMQLSSLVIAQATTTTVGQQAAAVSTNITYLICRIFQLVFYIAGAITALVIVVAGIKWIGSGDDPASRGAAKGTIVHAIIGLIIVIMAVYLVGWVIGGFGGLMYDPSNFLSGCGQPII